MYPVLVSRLARDAFMHQNNLRHGTLMHYTALKGFYPMADYSHGAPFP